MADAVYDPKTEKYWDEEDLHRELLRVFDICNGCRLCFNLCPSFPAMFDAIDTNGEEAANLGQQDLDRVVDLCYNCKLCYPKCPYIPPHEFALDFPALMLRAKAVRARKHGVTRQDRFLGDPERTGRMGSGWRAPIANWGNRNRLVRRAMEGVIGIHRDRNLPEFQRETFERWVARNRPEGSRPAGAANGKVALFYTCTVNFYQPQVGIAAVKVLEHNGVEVAFPEQRCCGMPALDGGDVDGATARAAYNVERLAALIREGYEVVAPGPTCSYTLRREYPVLLGTPESELVAGHTYDICEYLMLLHKEKRLALDFVARPGKVGYHIPCHLKVQNIGYKTRDLLKLIPGCEVQLVDRCAGVDGTWGLKKEYYELSVKVAEKLVKGLQASGCGTSCTDCGLAGLQIEQGTGERPRHPIEVVAEAYGLTGR